MRAWVAACLIWLVGAACASAEVRTPAKVRYTTKVGHSAYVRTIVSFLTGSELNELTKSSRYSIGGKYAVIFFKKDQAVVVEASGVSLCPLEFDLTCFPMVGNFKGKDQDGDEWEICTSQFCY